MIKSDTFISDTRVVQAGRDSQGVRHYDSEFGGPEERRQLEKKLLRKVDARMSILVVIYILNYVSLPAKFMRSFHPEASASRLATGAPRIHVKPH